ncbi:MAG: glycerol-3-phosphate 1-O-acyltransferase PlsY [Formosimonas sp.]
MSILFWLVAAYLVGSISFAIVLSKVFQMQDPRSYGSNNPGATNMLRSGRKKVALLTLLGDGFKGFLPVWLAQQTTDFAAAPLAAIALAAFVGHLYPIFFQFQGGKGVATFLGAILALSPMVGAAILGVWLLVATTLRYSSLASLTASVAALILLALQWDVGMWLIYVTAMVGLLFFRHRANIRKLAAGTESKLFAKPH